LRVPTPPVFNPNTETIVGVGWGATLGVLQIVNPTALGPPSASIGPSVSTVNDILGYYSENYWVIDWGQVATVTASAPYDGAYGASMYCQTDTAAAVEMIGGIPQFVSGNYLSGDERDSGGGGGPFGPGNYTLTVVFNKFGVVSVDYGY
jgi:hypothetical protein